MVISRAKNSLISFLGSIAEWYEFVVYAFPAHDPRVSMRATLGAFAGGIPLYQLCEIRQLIATAKVKCVDVKHFSHPFFTHRRGEYGVAKKSQKKCLTSTHLPFSLRHQLPDLGLLGVSFRHSLSCK